MSFKTTNCTDDKPNGKINVTVENYDENAEYSVSFNGGSNFYKMNGKSLMLSNCQNKFYEICVMKNGDVETLTDKHIVYVGNDKKNYAVQIHLIKSDEDIYKDGIIKVVIDNYDPAKRYELVWNNGQKVYPMKQTINLVKLGGGNYKIHVREISTGKKYISQQFEVDIAGAKSGERKYIKADMILQNPELPTGCEITSLTMLLNYIGFKADKLVLADKYLPKGEYRASDPYKVFVGDPRFTFAYGCYSNPIVEAAEKYLAEYDKKSVWEVRNITGCGYDNLYAALDRNCPVIAWATIDMKEPVRGSEWLIPGTNTMYVWTAREHCVLLVGYDKSKNLVYINDPLKGITSYDKTLFEKRFSQMGSHAVIIIQKEVS
ncbi:MAG: C39 family peptidase [Oscillospiraceae bacterium]